MILSIALTKKISLIITKISFQLLVIGKNKIADYSEPKDQIEDINEKIFDISFFIKE